MLEDLLDSLRGSLQTWHDRLEVLPGLKAMCQVSEGFRVTGGSVEAWKNRQAFWQTLAEVPRETPVGKSEYSCRHTKDSCVVFSSQYSKDI